MRIALISEHASPLAALGSVDAGGQNVYVDKVARCLAARGHSVDVMTRRDDTAQPPVTRLASGVRVVHVPAGPPRFVCKEALLEHMPEFATHVVRRAANQSYDIVHANFFMSGQVGLRLKAALALPMVMTFHALGLVRRMHQGASDGFPVERIDIERRIVAGADRLIAECPQDADDLVDLYDAAPARIATVPCGVDLAQFAPLDRARARQRLGIGQHEFVVLQLGRMVPRKGVDNVIRAVGMLQGARLVVVGGDAPAPGRASPSELDRLAALAAECGIADRVDFAGQQQRALLAAYYAACDVFVTTPWYEPFGITPLEAMAAARPVVGSAVGGIQHTVVDGETGYLVPPRDPAALADRLARLQAAPAMARAMGLAGARRVRRCFTWERVAQQLEVVYGSVVAAARQPASSSLRMPAALPTRLGAGRRTAPA